MNPFIAVNTKQVKHRFRNYILGLFTLAFMASSLTTIFLPNATYAATLNSDSKLVDQVLAYATYSSMIDCLAQEKQQIDDAGFGQSGFRISEAHAKSGDWWMTEGNFFRGTTQGAESPGSYLNTKTKPESGNTLCNNIVKKAISDWGFSDGLQFMCSFVYARANNSSCATGTGDFGGIANSIDRFKSVMSARIWGGSPKITLNSGDKNAGLYLLYRDAFLKGCNPRESASPGKDFAYKDIVIYKNDGSVTTKTYEGVNRSDTRAVYRTHDGRTISQSCGEIAANVNKYAPDFKKYVKSEPDGVGTTTPPGSDDTLGSCDDTDSPETASSCRVDYVGWIVCPVVNFMSQIVDAAYKFVTSLLVVQPLMTTGDTKELFTAWGVMRNIANVAFVIVFLIIIFSQLSGLGVSNYGVKKMLPRLVIAAIFVNLSFYVCAIAIDASNILGTSITSVFNSVGASIAPPVLDSSATGAGWVGIAGGILAGVGASATLYYVGLSALIPALLAALVAIVTVFAVLVLRQALIVLLVVVAPLAFVAYLLPNTEDLFTKWRKLLITMLLMFPVIAGIFGASALASSVVMNSAEGDYAMAIQIMGACIAILPLALTPIVMRAAGGVLNRFAGIVNNVNRGPIDRMRRSGEKYREGRNNLRNARALNGQKQLGRGSFIKWRARQASIAGGRQAEANRANTEYVADKIGKDSKFRNAVAGGSMGKAASEDAMQRALASSINSKAKLEAEELTAASVVLKNARLDQGQIREIAAGRTATVKDEKGNITAEFNGGASTAIRAAAIQSSVASNDVEAINSLWNESRTWTGPGGDKLREVFADSLQSSSGRPAYMSQGVIAGLRTPAHANSPDIRTTVEAAIKNNTYSPEKIAGADKDELNIVAQVLAENHELAKTGQARISDNERQMLLLNAEQALSDTRLRAGIGKNLSQVENIVNFRAPDNPVRIEGALDVQAPTVSVTTPTTPTTPMTAPSAPTTSTPTPPAPQPQNPTTPARQSTPPSNDGVFTISHDNVVTRPASYPTQPPTEPPSEPPAEQ